MPKVKGKKYPYTKKGKAAAKKAAAENNPKVSPKDTFPDIKDPGWGDRRPITLRKPVKKKSPPKGSKEYETSVKAFAEWLKQRNEFVDGKNRREIDGLSKSKLDSAYTAQRKTVQDLDKKEKEDKSDYSNALDKELHDMDKKAKKESERRKLLYIYRKKNPKGKAGPST